MDDARVWEFEESLWTADADHYRNAIDDQCVMVVPTDPFVLGGSAAIQAVINTPRWTEVEITDRLVSRPEEGLIVVAYKVSAAKDGDGRYTAYCTSTYRRLGHDDWRVVQHQQTPPAALQH